MDPRRARPFALAAALGLTLALVPRALGDEGGGGYTVPLPPGIIDQLNHDAQQDIDWYDKQHQPEQQPQPASPAEAPPPAVSPIPEPAPVAPGVTADHARPGVVRSGGGIWIASPGLTMQCPAGDASCRLLVRVDTPPGAAGRRAVRLGSVHTTVPAGLTQTVSVPLSKTGTRLLRRRGRMRVIFSVAATASGSAAVSTRRAATLAAPAGHRPAA